MKCRKCDSGDLRMKRAAGLEFILLLFISRRKYQCRKCGYNFRAEDRRQHPREEPAQNAHALPLR